MEREPTKILDAFCGSRMFWFNKENQDVTFMDNRELDTTFDGDRKLLIKPDVMANFTNMPFPNDTFYHE